MTVYTPPHSHTHIRIIRLYSSYTTLETQKRCPRVFPFPPREINSLKQDFRQRRPHVAGHPPPQQRPHLSQRRPRRAGRAAPASPAQTPGGLIGSTLRSEPRRRGTAYMRLFTVGLDAVSSRFVAARLSAGFCAVTQRSWDRDWPPHIHHRG